MRTSATKPKRDIECFRKNPDTGRCRRIVRGIAYPKTRDLLLER